MLTKLIAPLGMCLASALAGRSPGLQLPPILEPTPPANAVQVQAPAEPPEAPEAPQVESPPPGERRRASAPVTTRELRATLVKDDQGEIVAKVQDLVIDPCSGRVVYAALSLDQMAGGEESLYVVPWKYVETLAGSHELRLVIEPDVVKRGPRFERNRWPNFADRAYAAAVEQYYADACAAPREIRGRPILR